MLSKISKANKTGELCFCKVKAKRADNVKGNNSRNKSRTNTKVASIVP